MTANEEAALQPLFENPPWRNGARRYRMGLSPIPSAQWFPRRASSAEREFKRTIHALHGRDALDVVDVDAASLAARAVCEHFKLPANTSLEHAALLVPDDLCVMRRDADIYRLVAASLCSPSYWALQQKMGRTLNEIHQPVDGLNERLAARMNTFFSNLPTGRVFERHNWFLHADRERFHPLEIDEPQLAPELLQVRSERQTLRRLEESVVLFTIDVRFAALKDIRSYPEAALDMLRAFDSWSAIEQAEFGLADLCPELRPFLQGCAEGRAE